MKAGSALVITTATAVPKQTQIGASVWPFVVRRSQMRPARNTPSVFIVMVEMPSTWPTRPGWMPYVRAMTVGSHAPTA